ncbi:MAG: 1,4-alpha-glucan branching protein GlgB [Veillonellales bacterium]
MNLLPLSEQNIYLFHEGTQYRSYQMLGSHVTRQNGVSGVKFALWAPNAVRVGVVGNFNGWQAVRHEMQRIDQSGIWSLFIPELESGELYKYEIDTFDGRKLLKADPYAFRAELRPGTASRVCELSHYSWQDAAWQQVKRQQSIYEQPVLIYEVHLGSWRRNDDGEWLSYREMADQLADYAAKMGYTHVELLPVGEHPFDGSWGYQTTGYYAVTSRYGPPEDFMYLVDRCHDRGIGVIMDWAPGHFCKDDHGLRLFDGTALYEPACPERGENPEWGTANFDYGRPEVRSFLISNALFWLDIYHIDGIRVDAVANILYLDYAREPGQWTPNRYGGNGNLEGAEFIRKLNETVFLFYPETMMIAEESTTWPLVSRPTYAGGLGFNFKWNMGWMNDMLRYMSMEGIHRQWHHELVTFSLMYAFSENFILPLSHDEVVHGKKSLLDKMPGDYWQKFAGLRAFYGYWMAHPGKKLLFMGGEFGQFIEWKYNDSLDWHLLDYPMHHKLHQYVRALNRFYCREAALWQIDFDWHGFAWIDCQDASQSIVSFIRQGKRKENFLIVVCNFTPEVREEYRIGVPQPGSYREIFNSDREEYGGSGQVNEGEISSETVEWHNREQSIVLRIPPLAVIYLQPVSGFSHRNRSK